MSPRFKMREMSQKANEVENPRQEVAQMLLLLINQILDGVFPGSITTVVDGSAKIHVDSINHDQFMVVARAARENPDLRIAMKRSGTGITIVFTKDK